MNETTEEKPEGKSETSIKLSTAESKTTHSKPSFKLHFVLREELGRSYILPYRQKKLAFPIVAPKFYSKYDCQGVEDIDPKIFEELKRLRESGPKEKYAEPATENQRYGWYTDPELDCDRRDRRFYFPRHTSEMVKLKSLVDHADSVTIPKRL